jgi:hypothetical protein
MHAVALAAALAATSWTTPVTIDSADVANPQAQGAGDGSVLVAWIDPIAQLAKRSGDGFAPLAPLNAADPFEKVWDGALDGSGNGILLSVRRHKPVQRIRATFVTADGKRSGPVTISDHAHSAAGPELSVAPDGTAVAAWSWHDPAGWRAQVAIRRPGQPRFDAPQTVSPPAPRSGRTQFRPAITVAAGDGGRAALTWQIANGPDEQPLHVLTAGTDGRFGADQALPGAGGYADAALAVDATGNVQLAWLDMHFSGHVAPSSLHVAQGAAGSALSAPAVLSTGGKGTSSGAQVAAAFSGDGSATVAWAKPGARYEEGGPIEAFTRPSGGAFGPAQTVTGAGAQGLSLAGGPGGSATLAWMVGTHSAKQLQWAVHAATRPQAGGAFGADETISDTSRNALWPSVAMTASGDAIATWVTNTDGSGGGQATAAIHHAG